MTDQLLLHADYKQFIASGKIVRSLLLSRSFCEQDLIEVYCFECSRGEITGEEACTLQRVVAVIVAIDDPQIVVANGFEEGTTARWTVLEIDIDDKCNRRAAVRATRNR